MKRAEVLVALGLLVVALVVLSQAIHLGPGWGEDGPRAGFFPFWLAVVLGVSSLWVLVQALRAPGGAGARPFFPVGGRRLVLTVFLPMAGAIALLEVVGFYIASLIYLVIYIRLTGRQGWPLTLAVGVLFPLITFFIFERWFLILLPKGLFGERLLPF
ncbi:MAG: tripartite tricarboxylate transporter TctB family protein [Candidatus Rokubacteria bacterium]|nr:tripartite tricarboxylate transporter TctB family protein [Candidatus Rokubacteria bacterium]